MKKMDPHVHPHADSQSGAGKKWNLIIDVAGCENCNNCVLAAKDEYVGNDFPGYSAPHAAQGAGVIRIRRKVRGGGSQVDAAYLPTLCNHCDNAPCVAQGAGAVIKREDGIVVFDPVKAQGRRDLVDACPYGAVVWNEARQLPQTWIFDAHLLDQGWRSPRCVQVCPTGAIEALKISDEEMAARSRHDGLEVWQPEHGTQPRVHYRNLHRFDKCFIGGSVTKADGGRIECAQGVAVALHHRGETVAQTHSDVFGDFKFDHLVPGSGAYALILRDGPHPPVSVNVTLGADSLDLGTIRIDSEPADLLPSAAPADVALTRPAMNQPE